MWSFSFFFNFSFTRNGTQAAVLAAMASRKAAHEAAVASELAGVTPAIEAFFRPWLFPCCGTDCTCVEGDGQGVRRGVGRPHGEL